MNWSQFDKNPLQNFYMNWPQFDNKTFYNKFFTVKCKQKIVISVYTGVHMSYLKFIEMFFAHHFLTPSLSYTFGG